MTDDALEHDPTGRIGRSGRQAASADTLARVLRLLPGICGVSTMTVLTLLILTSADLRDGGSPTATAVGEALVPLVVAAVVSVVWSLVLAAFTALGRRYWPNGLAVVAISAVLFIMATVALVVGTLASESSTAGLALLFAPRLLTAILLVGSLAAALVHVLRTHAATR